MLAPTPAADASQEPAPEETQRRTASRPAVTAESAVTSHPAVTSQSAGAPPGSVQRAAERPMVASYQRAAAGRHNVDLDELNSWRLNAELPARLAIRRRRSRWQSHLAATSTDPSYRRGRRAAALRRRRGFRQC